MTEGERYWYERCIAAEKALESYQRRYATLWMPGAFEHPMRPCYHATYVHYEPVKCGGGL